MDASESCAADLCEELNRAAKRADCGIKFNRVETQINEVFTRRKTYDGVARVGLVFNMASRNQTYWVDNEANRICDKLNHFAEYADRHAAKLANDILKASINDVTDEMLIEELVRRGYKTPIKEETKNAE